jgi:PAS domain S-box-containing protein
MDGLATALKTIRESEIPKAKILLVDDNVDVLRSMTAVLESLGEDILTATGANAALKHLLKHEPAVIVLDVMMPEVDGFQLSGLIRQRERFRNTPIIFLTGLGTEDRHMLQGYQSGAVDYMLKPVDPDVLRYKVRIFVDLFKKNAMLQRYAEAMRVSSAKLEQSLHETIRAKQELEREIEERKIAEATRDRLAGQLGAAPDFAATMAEGAVTLSLDGTILYANARFREMVSRSESDTTDKPVKEFIPKEFNDLFEALCSETKRGRATTELELLSSKGQRIPVHLTMNSFAGENLQAIAMVVTDLRDQKRNEELIAEGRLARLILEQAHSGMAVCDSKGRIVLASRAIHTMCSENPLFQDFDTVFPLAFADKRVDSRPFSCAEVLSGKQFENVEVNLVRKTGLSPHLLMNAGRIMSDDGVPIGCLITVIDISERKNIEEALRRSEKLAAAGRIAGALAHEINNPLSAVTNALFLLQNSGLDESRHYYVDLASSELTRVSNIVRRTLSFYREAAKPVPVRLSEVLDSVLEVYTRQITERSIRVIKEYLFDQTIDGYPGELRQVFSNLIGNALDALKQHQEIGIRIRPVKDPVKGYSGVRVTIADRGHGISKENMAKLFEPFFTTKGEKGTGLGLWVTKGIIQKQGGSIRARSSAAPGNSWTVISVVIPTHARPELKFSSADSDLQTSLDVTPTKQFSALPS